MLLSTAGDALFCKSCNLFSPAHYSSPIFYTKSFFKSFLMLFLKSFLLCFIPQFRSSQLFLPFQKGAFFFSLFSSLPFFYTSCVWKLLGVLPTLISWKCAHLNSLAPRNHYLGCFFKLCLETVLPLWQNKLPYRSNYFIISMLVYASNAKKKNTSFCIVSCILCFSIFSLQKEV